MTTGVEPVDLTPLEAWRALLRQIRETRRLPRRPPATSAEDSLSSFRCEHGHLFLGCDKRDCVQQNEYIARNYDAVRRYSDSQIQEVQAVLDDLGKEGSR